MKKVLIGCLFALIVSGCATDGVYNNFLKPVYIGGEKVIIKNWNDLPKETQNFLKKVDKGAKGYNTIRESVKKSVDTNSSANAD